MTAISLGVAATPAAPAPPLAPIPLCAPMLGGAEWAYVRDCLESGWVSSVGVYVERFERAIAAALGIEHAVAMSSGTAALHIAWSRTTRCWCRR
jgi:dTDP-4-amino-4,6-dideoxygalactose transaminase